MTGKRQADWAERTARKFCGHAEEAGCPLCNAIAATLRRAEKRGYQRGKTDGYKEGHEDQLEMRRIERRECERT